MSRRQSREREEMWREVDEVVEEKSISDFWTEFCDPENTDIPFVWEGEGADPDGNDSIRRAFALSGRTGLLGHGRETTRFVLSEYYITDTLPGDEYGDRDSRSLSNKYEGEKARLIAGRKYYLRQI